eukprot:UN03739
MDTEFIFIFNFGFHDMQAGITAEQFGINMAWFLDLLYKDIGLARVNKRFIWLTINDSMNDERFKQGSELIKSYNGQLVKLKYSKFKDLIIINNFHMSAAKYAKENLFSDNLHITNNGESYT